MNCKEYLPLVERLADGEVTAAEKSRAEDHLKACENCRAHLRFLESLARAAREGSSPSPPESYWDGLPGKVMARIAEGEERRKQPQRGFFGLLSPSGLRWAGALAAAVVAAVVGLRVLEVPLSSRRPSADVLQPSSSAPRDTSGKTDQPAEGGVAESEEQAAREASYDRETPMSSVEGAPGVPEMGDDGENDRVLGAQSFEDRSGNELLFKERAMSENLTARDEAEPAAPQSVGESFERELASESAPQATRPQASEQPTSTPAGAQALPARPDEVAESRLTSAPNSPTAADDYRALSERYPLEPSFQTTDRLAATSPKEEASGDKASECVAWRQFVDEHRGSEQEPSARYRLALCAIRLSELEPTADRRRQAREESQAFLALEPSGARADEIRRALERVEQ